MSRDAKRSTKARGAISRRALLAGGAGATASLLLRGLATGLPPAFLAAPRVARAQAQVSPQTLILATSSRGDPVNVNCPGSYVDGAQNNPLLAASQMVLGGVRSRAAEPWVGLPGGLRRRLAFFHLSTRSAAHPEYASTLTFHGSVKNEQGNGAEMFPSMLADLSAARIGTHQSEPVPLSNEVLTVQGQPIQGLRPSELKALFVQQMDRLEDLRALRDQALDTVHATVRQPETSSARDFIDRYVQSRDQSRALGNQLGELLARLPTNPEEPDTLTDRIVAAVALARLRVAPVITLNIPFGGDNHRDADLSVEAEETRTGVEGIATLWRELGDAGLRDDVSFAMLNVFGRELTRNNGGGRNHNRHHGVMVAFGAGVRAGVYGGVDRDGRARAVDHASGEAREGGSIPAEETLESAGKSLALALGHDRDTIERRIQGGRFVEPFAV
jgi:hypothetical protein